MEQSGEVTLRDLVHYLLVPARCGIYLSRDDLARIGRRLGAPPAPVSRGLMLEHLFRAAGRDGRVVELIDALTERVSAWQARYDDWRARYPSWTESWQRWRRGSDHLRRRLDEMRDEAVALAQAHPPVG
ncbi:MAG TPA: hypothetical protein VEQ11_15670 [Chloroflexota bacterium]|nr:hypothetical protein [Chloroflexota bacterium]